MLKPEKHPTMTSNTINTRTPGYLHALGTGAALRVIVTCQQSPPVFPQPKDWDFSFQTGQERERNICRREGISSVCSSS